MKVNVCQMVEIDTDVNVDIADLFAECFSRTVPEDPGRVNRLLEAVSTVVQFLQAVDGETIEAVKPGARKMVADAIAKEAARWAIKVG